MPVTCQFRIGGASRLTLGARARARARAAGRPGTGAMRYHPRPDRTGRSDLLTCLNRHT